MMRIGARLWAGSHGRLWPAMAALALLLALRPAAAQSVAYCNVTSVDAKQLSNGVQVTIQADGVLDWTAENDDWSAIYGGSRREVSLRMTNAKSKVNRTFIDVSKFPVSYIQLKTPQDAKEGVGLTITVAMYEACTLRVQRSTDQQSLIVTVNSERTIVSRAASGTNGGSGQSSATMQVTREGKNVSVLAVKAKLLPLLAEVARISETDIAVDDSVKDREVSMRLDNLPVDEVLHAVSSAYGLAISHNGGVYMICDGVPADLATYHLSGTESFRMKYIKAQTASGLLPTFLYSYLHVNEAQNAVVVTAPEQMLDKIRTDFGKIDLAPPQIMIEALAVETSSASDLNAALGVTYTSDRTNATLDSSAGDITYNTIGTLPNDFNAKLQALVANGKAQVRATPRMAAVNGLDADIFIGETKFIKVEVMSYGGKQERIQGVDVGVKLAVRPWTGGNGEITVTLKPEVSNISELDRESGMPVLSTRRAETTVRVKDGETIVIGGLTQRQDYRTRTKVPILGDIPFLGWAFQSTKTSSTNTELVVFITPHILDDRGRMKDTAKEDDIRRRLLQEGQPAAGK